MNMDLSANIEATQVQLSTKNNNVDNLDGEDGRSGVSRQTPPHSVFSRKVKLFIVFMTIFGSIFSPFSAFMYLPAITPIAESYGRPLTEMNLSVTVFQIMQALTPLFFGDLSDQIGRRPVYIAMFIVYMAANIGLALQNNYAALLSLRALQSTGCSATLAIGNAVMADITTSAERGAYIAAVLASIQFAPAIAPVLGGIIIQYWGWRARFWFLVISSGVFLAVYLPFAPETARNIVGNGSLRPPRLNASFTSIWQQRLDDSQQETRLVEMYGTTTRSKKAHRRIPIPNIYAAILIMFERDISLLLIFMSVFVMANFAILIPLQDAVRRKYNLDDLQVGLCYIPFAAGAIIASIIVGKLLNWNYARVAHSTGILIDRRIGDNLRNFPIEKARLDLIWPWTAIAVVIIAAWGWIIDSGVHIAVPLAILFVAGLTLTGPTSITTTLLVDLYPANPGRVSSTFNLTRATMNAIGTAVVQYIIDAWGYGFTYLFLGLLLAATCPGIWLVRSKGPRWREERYKRFERPIPNVRTYN